MEGPARAWHEVVKVATGEWFFSVAGPRPNGGSMVLMRSLWTSALIYLIALFVRDVTDPSSVLGWKVWNLCSWQAFFTDVHATMTWAGAIFAGAYVSLYSRFASQWTYLANLYNQLKETQVEHADSGKPNGDTPLADWKAAFIEDADDLHLATKPMFASIIRAWATEADVERAFVAPQTGAVGGKVRFDRIVTAAKNACDKHAKKYTQAVSSG